ncbi:MAG: diguanylate cyclase [Candidatus Acidiferrum sp.]
MSRRHESLHSISGSTGTWLPIVGGASVLILSALLRGHSFSLDPRLFGQLQFTSGILAITFAGAAFVRFRGTRDPLPLVLAAGFVIVGVTLASSSLGWSALASFDSQASLRDPLSWVIGRTLLAILLVSAPLVQKRYAWSRNPARDIAAILALAVLVSALFTIVHRGLPSYLVVQPGHFFPHPGNLIPAAFFLMAAFLYHRRLRDASAPFDRSLYFAAAINFWCSLAAAQSDHGLDEPFVLAATLQFSSYAVILGGALLDNIHLFQNIQHLAMTDPVTGLANYRRLMDSLEVEIQRTGRTGRPFALLLFDLDRLKKINDQFGHQVGTRTLLRVADVLRMHSRAIDTAARHGGDEFALVLPETTEHGAEEVLERICERVANDGEQPAVSLSAGCALYPRDGNSITALMDAADSALYHMKELHRGIPTVVKHTEV